MNLSRLSLVVTILALSSCSRVFYQPDHAIHFPPEKNGFSPANIYFNAKDGTRLHAWYFAAKSPAKGTIIQFHGNAENISSHYATLVWLVKKGYSLFTFDYRGYGESSGEPSQEGIYHDGMAALDTAWELHQKSHASFFIVYGQSLGGAISMRCFADFAHRDDTALIVMDSTFMSYKNVAQQAFAKFWLTWPFQLVARPLVSDEYSSEAAVDALKTRLLVIHDHDDPIMNFKNGRELFERAKPQKEFWELDLGRHIGVFSPDTPENRVRFLKLLDSLRS